MLLVIECIPLKNPKGMPHISISLTLFFIFKISSLIFSNPAPRKKYLKDQGAGPNDPENSGEKPDHQGYIF